MTAHSEIIPSYVNYDQRSMSISVIRERNCFDASRSAECAGLHVRSVLLAACLFRSFWASYRPIRSKHRIALERDGLSGSKCRQFSISSSRSGSIPRERPDWAPSGGDFALAREPGALDPPPKG